MKKTKNKLKMYNLHLYFKQGADLSNYLNNNEKDVPASMLNWIDHLEKNIKSLKKLAKQLDKKKIKCLADTNDIALISNDANTIALLDSCPLLTEDRITVELFYAFKGKLDTKLEKKLEGLAQKFNGELVNSGCGFGQRDMEFEFDTQDDADEFEQIANEIIPKAKK